LIFRADSAASALARMLSNPGYWRKVDGVAKVRKKLNCDIALLIPG